MTVTWRELIGYELKSHPGEELVSVAPDESVLDVEFDDDFGHPEGPAFTAWTQNRVIFPVCYDGAESVASVPRNPRAPRTRRTLAAIDRWYTYWHTLHD